MQRQAVGYVTLKDEDKVHELQKQTSSFEELTGTMDTAHMALIIQRHWRRQRVVFGSLVALVRVVPRGGPQTEAKNEFPPWSSAAQGGSSRRAAADPRLPPWS